MSHRSLYLIALGLFSGVAVVSAQPGPLSTTKNTSLVLPVSTLLTNGLPGLSGPPVTLMVGAVQSISAQGGTASLAGSQMWADRYNGPVNNEDQAFAVAVDSDGNIIVGGYSVGTGFTIDYLTIKYTPDGTALWTNRYDSGGSDRIESVATDGSGGVYVSGEGGSGIITIKYASDGTPVWTNIYSTGDSLSFNGLAVDSAGNAYMLPFDVNSNSLTVVKYDVNGNPAWTNYFIPTPTGLASASSVAVDASGNIFVAGFYSDSGLISFMTLSYASDGTLLWANPYSLTGGESADSVIVDPSGNVIVIGDSQGGGAQHKYAIVEYSNNGTLLWTNTVAAANYVGGGTPRIATDLAGNVFVVGATPGADGTTTADFTSVKFSNAGAPIWTNRFVDANSGVPGLFGAATDNAGNLYWSINSASPNGTNYNYVTLKYAAANGTAVWTNRYNGPANSPDDPRAMTVDKAGGVYVTGTSSSGGSSFGALDFATVKYADLLRYTPPSNFVGQDTITFTAFDSFGNSAIGTVTVNVLAGPPIVVAPGAYTSAAGDGSLNTLIRNTNAPRTYQMQFTPNALGGLPVGAEITGLAFRLYTNIAVAFPSTTTSWSDYEVTLAQAANPIGAMSTTFSANLRNPTLVKHGVLSLSPGSFSTGSIPNPFATLIAFDKPYVYQGGDLMMQFTHTGSDSINASFLDAAGTASPGYGISYRALSATTFGATTGSVAAVTIAEIVFVPTIAITSATNQVILTVTGGLSGVTFQILSSTNITLPAAQWMPIYTNQFGASGGFSFTNPVQPEIPSQYFRVILP